MSPARGQRPADSAEGLAPDPRQDRRRVLRLDPRWQSRQRLLHLLCWLVLCAAPLFLLLRLGLESRQAAAQQPATGDQLTDDYISLMLAAWQDSLPSDRYDEVLLPEASRERLRQQHPDDPRVSEILLLQLLNDNSVVLKERSRRALELIRECERSGGLSAPLAYRLLIIQNQRWRSEARDESGLKRPAGARRGSSALTQYEQELARWVDARHGAERDEALRLAKKSAPDEALPSYFEGMRAAESGDFERAWRAIREGNSKAKCGALLLHPDAEFVRLLGAGRLPQEDLASAMLCVYPVGLASMAATRQIEALGQDAVARQDLALLGELHTCLCRIALSGAVHSFTWTRCLRGMEYLRFSCLPSIAPQAGSGAALQQLDAALAAAKQSQGTVQVAIPANQYQPGLAKAGKPLDYLPATMQFLKSSSRNYGPIMDSYLNQRAWYEAVSPGGAVHGATLTLADFDYASLSWRQPQH